MMPQVTEKLLESYTQNLCDLYGRHLVSVILYGSYARGDYTPESDIDVMILVDLDDKAIKQEGKSLSYMTYDYNFDHELTIMPYVVNIDHFNKWLGAYPFYNNVKKEGKEIYVSCPKLMSGEIGV